MSAMLFLAFIAYASAAPSTQGPCLFDGRTYAPGETIMIATCLATMDCLGDNNFGNLKSIGGVCPEKREADGQSGCLFDGRVYNKEDKILIQPCLAVMTCDGYNSYNDLKSLGGVCPSEKRETNGQLGCLFDGQVYATGEKIIIPNCLGEMTCLGRNSYSPITSFGGVCPQKRQADGQTGCLFDGKVYSPGEDITVNLPEKCLAKFTCLGYNNISPVPC